MYNKHIIYTNILNFKDNYNNRLYKKIGMNKEGLACEINYSMCRIKIIIKSQ
jgi:hypothetical protein